ncbi:MAG: protein kinase, partial [Planctomycetales bacterium]|nr:protein kinase [Planctomycetales bacterium]
AHERGVIHRDVKPGNLMVDAKGKLWVTDFGLARIENDASLTITGDLLGTLKYMSPEQASGSSSIVDHRADIYGLGITLYELLALYPAFSAKDRGKLLRQIEHDAPPPLRKINNSVSLDLATVIGKSIAKAPSERYRSAADLAEDLQRILELRPIIAKPPRWPTLIAKWSRRHVAAVWAIVSVLSVLTAGFGVTSYFLRRAYQRESDARQIASHEKELAISAKRASKEAAARADLRTRESEAVRAFLMDDVLGRATSKFEMRSGARLTDALTRASDELDTRFEDQPQVEASLRMALSNLYLMERNPEVAQPHAERALELLHKIAGPAHPNTLEAHWQLFWVGLERKIPADYLQRLRILKDLYQQHLPDDPARIEVLLRLSYCLADWGQLDEADALLSEASSHYDRIHEKDSYLEEEFEATRGMLSFKRKDFDESYQHFANALKIASDGDPHMLALRRNLTGNVFMRINRQGEAIELMRLIAEYAEKSLAAEHPLNLANLRNLTSALFATGQFEEAAQAGRIVANLMESSGDLLSAIELHGLLGRCYRSLDDRASSIEAYKKALQLARLAPSSDKQACALIDATGDLAWALSRDYGQPMPDYEDAIALLDGLQKLQPENPSMLLSRGAARLGMGELQPAIDDLESSLASRFGGIDLSTRDLGDLHQTGVTALGSAGFAWRRIQIETSSNANSPDTGWVIWRVDGREVARTPCPSGIDFESPRTVTLGYMDMFPSVCATPNLTFGLIDNLQVTSKGQVYVDDFESNSSHRYRTCRSSEDTSVLFAYNYIALGVPRAPNSGALDSKGLRLEANRIPPASSEAVTVHTKTIFNGPTVVEFDAWLNFGVNDSSATEYLTFGVGGDGKTLNSASAAKPLGSGSWFAMDGDGGTMLDFRIFIDQREQRPFGGPHGSGMLDSAHHYFKGRGKPSNEYFYLAMCHAGLHNFGASHRCLELAERHIDDSPSTEKLRNQAYAYVKETQEKSIESLK